VPAGSRAVERDDDRRRKRYQGRKRELDEGEGGMAAITDAAELAALVDTMIPGDELFPSAAAVGTHGLVGPRLRQLLGRDGLARLSATLGPLAALDRAGREAAVGRLEKADPELFGIVQMTIYLSYYEQPAVVAAVRAMGHDYNDAPQPDGYALPPFDPDLDLPRRPRGAFVATAEVRRLDLTTLDFLHEGRADAAS
jgi:hypothetical protein